MTFMGRLVPYSNMSICRHADTTHYRQSPNCRRARKVSQCSARLLSGGAFFCTATTCAAIAGRQARAFRRAVLQELAGHPARVRRTALAHALDVCKTENPTRDTTHGGACLTWSLPVYRKRPFTTHADRLRPRLEGRRLPVAGPAARRAADRGRRRRPPGTRQLRTRAPDGRRARRLEARPPPAATLLT